MKELSDQIDTVRQKLRAADDALAGLSATEAGRRQPGRAKNNKPLPADASSTFSAPHAPRSPTLSAASSTGSR